MLRFPDRELSPDDPERGMLDSVAGRLGVSAADVALAGSMSEYIDDALALRPQVGDAARQQALTERFLMPVVPALTTLFLALRAELDPAMRQACTPRRRAAYPLGQCLGITSAVLAHLEAVDPARLGGAAAEAWAALQAFRAAGGGVRRAWGDLRGEYFQNALIVGTLYVDVANDTVVVTKPPVEILPLAEADFRPIADHLHFARIAARYWKHRVLPNHLVPEIAAYAPLIQIAPSGTLRVGPLAPYMLALTLAGRFAPSAQALSVQPLPPRAFESLRAAIRGEGLSVAASPVAGRDAALAACAEARSDCAASFNRAVTAAHEVNRRLSRFVAVAA